MRVGLGYRYKEADQRGTNEIDITASSVGDNSTDLRTSVEIAIEFEGGWAAILGAPHHAETHN